MTENHNYNTPAQGTRDWHTPLNENFEQLDVDVPVRDDNSNRNNYTPHAGALYIAVDTGDIYRGTGATWTNIGSITGGESSGLTAEEVRDTIAAFASGGTNITVTHNDANNELLFETSALAAEQVRDEVGGFVVGGTDISVTHDDANDTLTVDYTGSGSSADPIHRHAGSVALVSDGTNNNNRYRIPVHLKDTETVDVSRVGLSFPDSADSNDPNVFIKLFNPAGSQVAQIAMNNNPHIFEPSGTMQYTNSSGGVEVATVEVVNLGNVDYTNASAGPDAVEYSVEYTVS